LPFFLLVSLLGAAALGGLIVGLKLGRRWARTLLVVALVLLVVSFALYVAGTNYARSVEQWGYQNLAQSMAMIAWLALYAASGFLGPAVYEGRAAAAIALSMGATIVALTFGTYWMFMLACGFAGECL
jgi:hypothetical protein